MTLQNKANIMRHLFIFMRGLRQDLHVARLLRFQGNAGPHFSKIKGRANKSHYKDATQAQFCSLRTISLDGAARHGMCRSYCAGMRGTVIVFNEGALYRFSAGHPPPDG